MNVVSYTTIMSVFTSMNCNIYLTLTKHILIENTYNCKFYILLLVRIISWNAPITTNTLLIHCTKTICLTYSLNGQFTNANGTKERIYPHSFSVYGEGERRSRILASFKIAYIVGVVRKRFNGVCGDVSMAMGWSWYQNDFFVFLRRAIKTTATS